MFGYFSGEYVAQFKFTVLLMPNGPLKITGADFDPEQCSTENKIENDEILVSDIFNAVVEQAYFKKLGLYSWENTNEKMFDERDSLRPLRMTEVF